MEEGRMSVDSDEAEMIINEIDGLPNLHPNYNEFEFNQHSSRQEAKTIDDLINDEDLPTSVIVTNLDSSLFKSDELKEEFLGLRSLLTLIVKTNDYMLRSMTYKEIESLFKQFGETASFQYFRSFRRMRVNYNCPNAAAKARIQMHQTQFLNTAINCYFAQPVTPIDASEIHLQPPALTKQFLISPPASPPVGWEPRDEGEPLVNYDLLAAIANLTPGETHELHAASSNQPGIVVHVCEEGTVGGPKARIAHTRCPNLN